MGPQVSSEAGELSQEIETVRDSETRLRTELSALRVRLCLCRSRQTFLTVHPAVLVVACCGSHGRFARASRTITRLPPQASSLQMATTTHAEAHAAIAALREELAVRR